MSSRDRILKQVFENKPPQLPLPDLSGLNPIQYQSPMEQFKFSIEKIGGTVVFVEKEVDCFPLIEGAANGQKTINTLQLNADEKQTLLNQPAEVLQHIHTAIFRGFVGVAENGAVWLDELAMVNRLLPFICENIILLLDSDRILSNMHEAYQQVQITQTGYGVFISGPSKTADIEQSLVIGAHGPKSLTIFLISKV